MAMRHLAVRASARQFLLRLLTFDVSVFSAHCLKRAADGAFILNTEVLTARKQLLHDVDCVHEIAVHAFKFPRDFASSLRHCAVEYFLLLRRKLDPRRPGRAI